MLTQTMIAPASPSQTLLSPWSLGGTGTKITGAGIETNTITADKINGTSLAVVNGTFSGSLQAATGSFSGSLTAQAVNAVSTINIAGDAITVPRAGQLGGTSYSDGVIITLAWGDFTSANVVISATAGGGDGFTGGNDSNPDIGYPNTYIIYRNGGEIKRFMSREFITFIDAPGGGATYQMGVVRGQGMNGAGNTTRAFLSAIGCKR
jgi:hypothetical protein